MKREALESVAVVSPTAVMNRAELVDILSEKASVTKKQADSVLTAAIDTIIDAVSSGDKVTLVGFGVFEGRDRAAREGRNPATGEKLSIPATRIPGFSAGKQFKDAVRERATEDVAA